PATGPDDLLGPRDVALGAVEADGQQGPRVVAAAGVHDPLSRYRRRDDVGRQPTAFPEDRAAGQVVAAQAVRARDDDLGLPPALDDDRRGPRGVLRAGHPPALPAGAFVEGHEER